MIGRSNRIEFRVLHESFHGPFLGGQCLILYTLAFGTITSGGSSSSTPRRRQRGDYTGEQQAPGVLEMQHLAMRQDRTRSNSPSWVVLIQLSGADDPRRPHGIHKARRTRDFPAERGRRGHSGYSRVDRHVLQAIPHFPAGARDTDSAPVEPDHST